MKCLCWVLTQSDVWFGAGDEVDQKSGSMVRLLKIPSVALVGLVVVVISNTWGFLDPTLEPHLREVSLYLLGPLPSA